MKFLCEKVKKCVDDLFCVSQFLLLIVSQASDVMRGRSSPWDRSDRNAFVLHNKSPGYSGLWPERILPVAGLVLFWRRPPTLNRHTHAHTQRSVPGLTLKMSPILLLPLLGLLTLLFALRGRKRYVSQNPRAHGVFSLLSVRLKVPQVPPGSSAEFDQGSGG